MGQDIGAALKKRENSHMSLTYVQVVLGKFLSPILHTYVQYNTPVKGRLEKGGKVVWGKRDGVELNHLHTNASTYTV